MPLDLRSIKTIFEVAIGLENLKCHDYYCHLIKNKYEKPRKWAKLTEEFELKENQHSEVYLLPFRVAREPYVRLFQYKVLNSIPFSNELLYKIGYVSNPNCYLCQETRETINHILFKCFYSNLKSFWNEVLTNILNKPSSCQCLSLRDVIIGILKEVMNLDNYIIILRKIYL